MSSKRIPYFDFYPADFMHGVRGLTATEVGVYTMLLCRIYEENGPVEYNAVRLSAYCGIRESALVKAIDRLVVLAKLTVEGGMLSNPRAMKEIEAREIKLKNNSRAGKASAEKRQQNQAEESTVVQRPFNHTDTDTDKRKEEANASSKKQPKSSKLADGWTLPVEWREAAIGKGLSASEVDHEGVQFANHHQAKGSRMVDWQKAWGTWVGNHVKWNAGKPKRVHVTPRAANVSPEFEMVLRAYGM